MDDSTETPSQVSGSYCMVKTPGKTEEKKGEDQGEKEKSTNHKEGKTQENTLHRAKQEQNDIQEHPMTKKRRNQKPA